MSNLITRTELRSVLADWEAGRQTAAQVHEWAESRYGGEWECEDDVANEVLGELDKLDMNLLVRDDVPVLLSMLELPADQAARASEMLRTRLGQSDLAHRKKELANDPFYAPFCAGSHRPWWKWWWGQG